MSMVADRQLGSQPMLAGPEAVTESKEFDPGSELAILQHPEIVARLDHCLTYSSRQEEIPGFLRDEARSCFVRAVNVTENIQTDPPETETTRTLLALGHLLNGMAGTVRQVGLEEFMKGYRELVASYSAQSSAAATGEHTAASETEVKSSLTGEDLEVTESLTPITDELLEVLRSQQGTMEATEDPLEYICSIQNQWLMALVMPLWENAANLDKSVEGINLAQRHLDIVKELAVNKERLLAGNMASEEIQLLKLARNFLEVAKRFFRELPAAFESHDICDAILVVLQRERVKLVEQLQKEVDAQADSAKTALVRYDEAYTALAQNKPTPSTHDAQRSKITGDQTDQIINDSPAAGLTPATAPDDASSYEVICDVYGDQRHRPERDDVVLLTATRPLGPISGQNNLYCGFFGGAQNNRRSMDEATAKEPVESSEPRHVRAILRPRAKLTNKEGGNQI